MKSKTRRARCIILVLILLLTSNVYAVDALNEATFTGTIIVDEETAEPLNLGEIEVKVYQSSPIEVDESYTIYGDEYAFSVYPDENGVFEFDRPSSVFSLTVDVNSLPEGYGIDHHTSMYLPEIRSDTFALSAVNRAEVVTDNLKYPSIVLFNGDGEEVYAPYEFTPTYQMDSQNDNIVEVSGTVNLGGNIAYSVSSSVVLPEIDDIYKVDLLYDVGAINEAQRIEKYIEIYESGMNDVICATPIIDEILEFYESNEYQTAPESLKVQIENLFQTPQEYATTYPNSVSNSYFTVHYSSNVTKTVAQNTLSYLTSLRGQAASLGFNLPINESGKTTLQIYITADSNSANGLTHHSSDRSKTSWSYTEIYNLNNLSTKR